MPPHLLTIPTELQLLIIDFAISDDFDTPTSVYDEAPTRHFAFEPIPTLGATSRSLSKIHPTWNHYIAQKVQALLQQATTAYGPDWEEVSVADLACGQLCPCGKGMMTSRVVLNEYIECVECNVKRRAIMELKQLLGELDGKLAPRTWKRVEQRKTAHHWWCQECRRKGDRSVSLKERERTETIKRRR